MGRNLQLEPAPVQLHPSVQGAASSQQQLFLAWMQSMGRRQVCFFCRKKTAFESCDSTQEKVCTYIYFMSIFS